MPPFVTASISFPGTPLDGVTVTLTYSVSFATWSVTEMVGSLSITLSLECLDGTEWYAQLYCGGDDDGYYGVGTPSCLPFALTMDDPPYPPPVQPCWPDPSGPPVITFTAYPVFDVGCDFVSTIDGAAYAIMTVTGETDFVTSIDGEAVAQVTVDGELDLLLSLDAEAVSQATVTGDIFMAFDFDGTLTPVMTGELDFFCGLDATVQAEGIQSGEIDFDIDFDGVLTPVMTGEIDLSSTWDATSEAEFAARWTWQRRGTRLPWPW